MSEYQFERPWHSGEIQGVDEKTRVTGLPPAATAHEAPKLLLDGPPLPRRLLLKGAEGSKVSLSFDDLFDGYEHVPTSCRTSRGSAGWPVPTAS